MDHKEWNEKLEVFNANIEKELFDVNRFYDILSFNPNAPNDKDDPEDGEGWRNN